MHMPERNGKIRLTVLRTHAAAGGEVFTEYEVETAEPLSVMALLLKVHEIEPSFACRTSNCFKGLCGSCLIRVNGKDVLGCTMLVRPGEEIRVEPHSGFAVIKDTVVDFSRPKVDGKGGSGNGSNGNA